MKFAPAPLLLGLLVPSLASSAQGPGLGGFLGLTEAKIENSEVAFRFFENSSTGDVELDVTDKQTGHVFRHRGAGLWKFELLDTQQPNLNPALLETLEPLDAPGLVSWSLQSTGSGQELVLGWDDVSSATLGSDSLDVQLRVNLSNGQRLADWSLEASSSMARYSIVAGRFHFSIEEDSQGGAVDHYFIDTQGFLTRNPAVTMPDWSIGTTASQIGPLFQFPILHYFSQVGAYYDSNGRGLYMSGADPVGTTPKSFFHKRAGGSGGAAARLDLEVQFFTDDNLNPASGFHSGAMTVGRFDGDWYDAADIYRAWLETTPIAAQGLVATRTDVAEISKQLQQAIVMSPQEDFLDIQPGQRTVADGINVYADHWGLEHLIAVNFGTNWAEGDACGIGPYDFDTTPGSAWPANVASMVTGEIPFGVYMADIYYAVDQDPVTGATCPPGSCTISPTFVTEGWGAVAVRRLDGSLVQMGDCGAAFPPLAAIDASSSQWLTRMDEIGTELGGVGMAGVYVDNLIPSYAEFCFDANHGHPVGFGTYYLEGFRDTLGTLVTSFQAANVAGEFAAFSETGGQEAYVPESGMTNGSFTFGDFQGDNPDSHMVPLVSVLFHHLAIQGIARIDAPFLQFEGTLALPTVNLAFDSTVWHPDPLEQEAGRRGAMYATAYALASGGSFLWCPDANAAAPKNANWSFEAVLSGSNPPQFLIDGLAHYQDVVEYAAVGSAYRGATSAAPFLNVGKRVRDLEFLTAIPTLIVPHEVFGSLPDAADNLPHMKSVPALVHGVWIDPLTGDVGISLANHSGQAISGQRFRFDPREYGLDPATTYRVYRVEPGQSDVQVALLSGAVNVNLPTLAAESFLFFKIEQ